MLTVRLILESLRSVYIYPAEAAKSSKRAEHRARTPLPSAIIWDSSPGAMADYREFVSGTWAAAEKMARAAAPSFAFSKEALDMAE